MAKREKKWLAVAANGFSLRYAQEELRADRKVLAAVAHGGAEVCFRGACARTGALVHAVKKTELSCCWCCQSVFQGVRAIDICGAASSTTIGASEPVIAKESAEPTNFWLD